MMVHTFNSNTLGDRGCWTFVNTRPTYLYSIKKKKQPLKQSPIKLKNKQTNNTTTTEEHCIYHKARVMTFFHFTQVHLKTYQTNVMPMWCPCE